MNKFNLLSFSLAVLLVGLTSCRSTKQTDTTTDKKEKVETKISYYSLTGFPAAQHWVKLPGPEVPLISAHRGKPELDGYAENSLESISKLIQSGSFILELDIAKSKDGVLFLFHDDDLDRLTRNTGLAIENNWSVLDTMRLLDDEGNLTSSTIPSLEEALSLAKGKAMFTLDRKQGVALSEIADAVSKLDMHTDVALILYNMNDFTEWANQETLGPISHQAKDVFELEQLAQRCKELYKRVGIDPFDQVGLAPNSGFVGVGLPDKKILAVAKTLNIKTTVGTFGDLDSMAVTNNGQTYRDLIDQGVSIIATNRPLLAHKAIYGK